MPPVNDYAHVSDLGVRNYLVSPPSDDYNVLAAQLRCANGNMMVDGEGKLLPMSLIERRFNAHEEACWAYSFLRPEGVHQALRIFWGIKEKV
jgi:hypothetical protein